jgi:WD40 repeat protein
LFATRSNITVHYYTVTIIFHSLQHPGVVRCVAVADNGDIVTGCADKTVRVWSRQQNRFASLSVRNEYSEAMAAAAASGAVAVDPAGT